MALLARAVAANRRFRVLVTESKPTNRGIKAAIELERLGIEATVILDTAVGYYIERVQMVLVGAEGVVENGGIINQIGTYMVAAMAKAANVPFYAVAERYKFVRCYPLSQRDMPTMSTALLLSGDLSPSHITPSSDNHFEPNHPTIDYTPPGLITLLFTDFGVLTPSAVSDELIKMYYD